MNVIDDISSGMMGTNATLHWVEDSAMQTLHVDKYWRLFFLRKKTARKFLASKSICLHMCKTEHIGTLGNEESGNYSIYEEDREQNRKLMY